MVVKPSELTPLSALALAELGIRAGIPEGVFSVIAVRFFFYFKLQYFNIQLT